MNARERKESESRPCMPTMILFSKPTRNHVTELASTAVGRKVTRLRTDFH